MLGQHPFRTGPLTIGMPGSEHGIPDWTPTIADLVKASGYVGQLLKKLDDLGIADNTITMYSTPTAPRRLPSRTAAPRRSTARRAARGKGDTACRSSPNGRASLNRAPRSTT
jgi:hypothetical protein